MHYKLNDYPLLRLLACLLILPGARALGQCELLVSGQPVVGAELYEFDAVALEGCDHEFGGPLAETGRWRLAEASEPQVVITSSPTFTGWIVMVAKSASGLPLSTEVVAGEWNTQFLTLGTPYSPLRGSIEVQACQREQVVLRSGVFGSGAVQYRWWCDGVELRGETGPSLSVVPEDTGRRTYYVEASNSCGNSLIGPFNLVVSGAPPYSSVRWAAAREGGHSASVPLEWYCFTCGGGSVTTLIEGTCNVEAFAFDARRVSIDFMGGGEGSRWAEFEFELLVPARLALFGVHSCQSSTCWNFGGSLVGMGLEEPLTPYCPAGPVELELVLVPGWYRLEFSGGGGWPCCYSGCWPCGNAGLELCACVNQGYYWRGELVVVPLACPGDLNEDGVVSSSDFSRLLDEWGQQGVSPADLNGDSVVDAQDVSVLLASWGVCP